MTQYIPKVPLVAEIENRIKKYTLLQQKPEMSDLQEVLQDKIDCLKSIKGYILNTLEAKEVDLEKELIEWHKEHFKKDGTFIGKSGFYLTNNSQMDIAKHFFELGMQVSNKSQKGE